MKIGDIVTQSDTFYKYWNGQKFKRKIINIKNLGTGTLYGHIIYLNKEVEIISADKAKIKIETSKLHEDYLKIDIQHQRKEKLKKLNETEIRTN